MKIELSKVDDVIPNIVADKILKVGTFKIDAHGTRLGEQFIKIIVDYAIQNDVDFCYATIYEKQDGLINLVERFGFREYGIKGTDEKTEKVFVKNMREMSGDINQDYPLVSMENSRKFLLSVYPQYHSIMFPNSILSTENQGIIKDISYSNSIHKIYVCRMGVETLKYGDVVVLYRTAEEGRSAEYSAVAISVCVVEEVKLQSDFKNFDEFYEYSCQYSLFDKEDFKYWYRRGGCKVIKLTYNAAFNKRIVRHDLIEKIGLSRNEYWGFFELTDKQFFDIIQAGEIEYILGKKA